MSVGTEGAKAVTLIGGNSVKSSELLEQGLRAFF